MTRKAFAVEEYTFSVGSLTASAGGLFDVYSERAINGLLHAVSILSNTFSANGSLILAVSGETGEEIWRRNGTANTSGTSYPRAQLRLTNDALVSGTGNMPVDNIALNSILRLTGSGLGNTTSGLGIKIIYL